jgi:hypothetical protein
MRVVSFRLWVLGLGLAVALAATGLFACATARARRHRSFRALLEQQWRHSDLPREREEVFVHQGLRRKYEWHIPYSRLLQSSKSSLPDDVPELGGHQAWQIAQTWLTGHGSEEPKCVSCETLGVIINPCDIPWNYVGAIRHFYRIRCEVALFDTMDVYVLMNGTVVEPTPTPARDEWGRNGR